MVNQLINLLNTLLTPEVSRNLVSAATCFDSKPRGHKADIKKSSQEIAKECNTISTFEILNWIINWASSEDQENHKIAITKFIPEVFKLNVSTKNGWRAMIPSVWKDWNR